MSFFLGGIEAAYGMPFCIGSYLHLAERPQRYQQIPML